MESKLLFLISKEKAEKVITEFPEQSSFVDAYFQQGLAGHNECWDNSIELAEYWTRCKLVIDSQ